MGLAASRQEAFWEACGFGHLDRAKHFLKEGDIDVNWVSYANDCCPIHVASQGKPEIVQLLLDHKCDVNVRDNRDNTPLHHAAMKGHVDIVQTLIDAGSDIDAQEKNGWTALHNAAYWCHAEVVKVLLKNGCDVHKHNKDMRTALHECARSRQKDDEKLGEIARLLIKDGSDINAQSSDWGEGDLTALMYASFHNHPDVANALIDAGCELNAVGTTFWSALHWAADRDNNELVYILLEAGIDPTIRDMRGETALERASSDDVREVLKTAIALEKEVKFVKTVPLLKSAEYLSQATPIYKPKCDANFKSQSFLPKTWKPKDSINVKNLINEKKSKLAAMTSEKYRTELARRTGTKVIENHEEDKAEGLSDKVQVLADSSKDLGNECSDGCNMKDSDVVTKVEGVDSSLQDNQVAHLNAQTKEADHCNVETSDTGIEEIKVESGLHEPEGVDSTCQHRTNNRSDKVVDVLTEKQDLNLEENEVLDISVQEKTIANLSEDNNFEESMTPNVISVSVEDIASEKHADETCEVDNAIDTMDNADKTRENSTTAALSQVSHEIGDITLDNDKS